MPLTDSKPAGRRGTRPPSPNGAPDTAEDLLGEVRQCLRDLAELELEEGPGPEEMDVVTLGEKIIERSRALEQAERRLDEVVRRYRELVRRRRRLWQ